MNKSSFFSLILRKKNNYESNIQSSASGRNWSSFDFFFNSSKLFKSKRFRMQNNILDRSHVSGHVL